jgi:Mannosyltransferase (PIG-V)
MSVEPDADVPGRPQRLVTRPSRTALPTPAIPAWVITPAVIGLASRVLSVVAIAAMRLLGPPRFPVLVHATNAFTAWDGQWYLSIAEHGYHAAPLVAPRGFDYAFFPLWPTLIWIASLGPWPGWVAAVALANALFVLAAVVVWRLLADVFGPTVATRGTALLAFAPPAFVFSLVYTESLFVLLSAAVLLGMRRGARWAIPAAFLVGLTRVTALAVGAAAAVGVVRRGGRPRRIALASGSALAIALLAWAAYNAHLTGDWLGFVHASTDWVPGTAGLPVLARELAGHSASQIPRLAFVILVTVASIRLLWVDVELAAYALGCVVLGVGFGVIWSMPRFVLVAFPAFGIVAGWAGRRGSIALVGLSIALQVLFTWMSISPHPIQGI